MPSNLQRSNASKLLQGLFFSLILGVIFIGMLWLGTFGTWHTMAWHWPAWLCLGGAGVLSLAAAFGAPRGRLSLPCVAVTLVMSAYLFWRIFDSVPVYRARMDLLLLLGALVTYGLFAAMITSSKTRVWFVGCLFLLGLANCTAVYYQMAFDMDFAFRGLFIEGVERYKHDGFPGGLFNNHNHFAGFMEVVTLLTWAMVFFGRLSVFWRAIFAIGGVFCFLALGVSASRGGFLAIGAGLAALGFFGVVLWLRMFPDKKKLILSLGIAGLAAGAVGGLVFFFTSLESARSAKGTGIEIFTNRSSRSSNWEIALKQWELSPVIGTGSRSYVDYFSKFWPPDFYINAGHAQFAHNDYVQTLAEYGIIGLGLVLAFVLVHAINGLRLVYWFRGRDGPAAEVRTSTNLALLAGSLSVLAAYAVHSFVDFNLHFPVNAVPVAFCFAICANPGFGPRRRNPAGSKSTAVVARLIPVVAGAVLLTLGWRWIPAEVEFARGEIAVDQGRLDASIGYFQDAVAKDPNIPGPWKRLGVSRYNQQFEDFPEFLTVQYLESALEAFDKAHALNPLDYVTMSYLGATWYRLGVSDQISTKRKNEALQTAQEWYEKTIDWAPMRYDLWMKYAALLSSRALFAYLQSDVEAAKRLLNESTEAYKKPLKIRGYIQRAKKAISENQRFLAEFENSSQSSP